MPSAPVAAGGAGGRTRTETDLLRAKTANLNFLQWSSGPKEGRKRGQARRPLGARGRPGDPRRKGGSKDEEEEQEEARLDGWRVCGHRESRIAPGRPNV